MIRAIGGWALLFVRSARASLVRGIETREWFHQAYEIGNRSAALVVVAMIFFGSVMVTVAYEQARHFLGNVEVLGPPYFQILVRELGPLATAILVAARFGASNAAELSAMAVNEQVDALRMSAGDPLADLVAPRILAGLVTLPALAVLGTAAAACSAAAVGTLVLHVHGMAFLDARYIGWVDLALASVKCLLWGAFIPTASAHAGLSAAGGANAVGQRTTEGVVSATLGCLVIDFCVDIAFRLVLP